MLVPLHLIKWDIPVRTNPDIGSLIPSLLASGQLEPITVEGPDQEGYYYLIHGLRRVLAMRSCPERFLKVECNLPWELSSQESRSELRLIMTSHQKRHTGLDLQLLYEEVEDNGQDARKMVPRSKRKRMLKGVEVPQELRKLYEKKRRSQDVLFVVYFLDCNEDYRNDLLKRLYEGELNCEHGDAIKKVVAHPKYKKLTEKQKRNVIEETIKKAKFTKNDAAFVIFAEMMKQSPTANNAEAWSEYLCDEIEKLTEFMHPDLANMLSTESKMKMKYTFDEFNQKLNVVVRPQKAELPFVKHEVKNIISSKMQYLRFETRNGRTLIFKLE